MSLRVDLNGIEINTSLVWTLEFHNVLLNIIFSHVSCDWERFSQHWGKSHLNQIGNGALFLALRQKNP